MGVRGFSNRSPVEVPLHWEENMTAGLELSITWAMRSHGHDAQKDCDY
jgi:hypothetical protein